jgi:tetratricopeptide (TPR) repeat protein
VAQAVTCPNCGSKIRAHRKKCPRCRAVLAAPDPQRAAARSRQLARTAGIIAGVFGLVVLTLWIVRGSEPSPGVVSRGAPSDPLLNRRGKTFLPRPPAGAVEEQGLDRPFLDPSGKGAAAYAAGDYAGALAQFQAAIQRNPQDAESLSNLGQVLVRMKRAEEAIPYFQRALAIVPDRWSYQFNLARALGLLGRMSDSIAAYRRAQQLFPDDYVTTFNLALMLHKAGDEVGAVDQYQKAIALQPEDASFRLALANSLVRLDKRPEAAAALQEYLRLSPSSPDADKVRARIAELTGAPDAGAKPQGSSEP